MSALRPVLRRSVLDRWRAPLTWGLPLGTFGALFAAMWPSVEDSLATTVANYPDRLKAAFNITRLDSVEAYIDAEMLSLIVPIAIGFMAVRSVTRALAGAEELGWLDTVLAAPLSRTTLVAGTFAATALVVAAVLAVMLVMTWLAGVIAGADPSFATLACGIANVWPLAIFFAGLATLACGVLRRAVQVTAVAIGTLIGMYIIDLLGKLSDVMEPARWVSAFRYYGSATRDGIDPLAFAGLTLAGLLLAAAGAALFERRDVR